MFPKCVSVLEDNKCCKVMCSLDKISKAGILILVEKCTRDVGVIIGEALHVHFEQFM